MVVLTGRLEVEVESDGRREVVRHIDPGESLGELALLSSTVRSASVRAVRDSELVVLSATRFEHLLAGDATFATAIARSLATVLRDGREGAGRTRPSVFGVVALDGGPVATALASDLVMSLRRWGTATLLDRSAAAEDANLFAALLDRCETANDYTVLHAAAGDGPEWTSFCGRSVDRVVGVASDPSAAESLDDGAGLLAGCDLVVGRRITRRGLTACVDRLQPRSIQTLRSESSTDLDAARLARRLTGRAVGLVLSGGGARGLAHIGVLERLAAAGIQIDRVGGTSMGGLVGTLFAGGWTTERMQATCREEFMPRRRLPAGLTLPGASMLRVRRVSGLVERAFGATLFEELPLDAFTVSADLEAGGLVVHRRGEVRDAVNASMAVPGLLPPVVVGGRVLVDGGVLDNLPVGVMAADGEGPVIAVDVMRRPHPSADRVPGVVETLVRAMVIGGSQATEENRTRADVLIEPAVEHIGFLDFERMDEALAAGRAATEVALRDGADVLQRPS